jgi:hypothetical protein
MPTEARIYGTVFSNQPDPSTRQSLRAEPENNGISELPEKTGFKTWQK